MSGLAWLPSGVADIIWLAPWQGSSARAQLRRQSSRVAPTCGVPCCTPLSAPSKPRASQSRHSWGVSYPGLSFLPPSLHPHFRGESAICFTSRSSAHCPAPFPLMHLRRKGLRAISADPEKWLMTSICLEADEKQVLHEACLATLDQAISESHHPPRVSGSLSLWSLLKIRASPH